MKNKSLIVVIVVIVTNFFIIGVWFLCGNKQEVKLDLESMAVSIQNNTVFSEYDTIKLDKSSVAKTLDIPEEDIVDAVGEISNMNKISDMYVIIEAQPNKVKDIRNRVEDYGVSYEMQWEKYLSKPYMLVRKRKIDQFDSYVYMIVSDEVNKIEELIVPNKD